MGNSGFQRGMGYGMRMRILLSVFVGVAFCLGLVGCQTLPGAGGPGAAARVPGVLMPRNLDQREAGYLGRIATLLEQNGLRPVDGGFAEFQLDFSIETGPVNADAVLVMRDGPRVMAQAKGRDGGPRIILNRSGVVDNAVNACLSDFSAQLRRGQPSY